MNGRDGSIASLALTVHSRFAPIPDTGSLAEQAICGSCEALERAAVVRLTGHAKNCIFYLISRGARSF
jgi:hypothetical protein